MVLRVSYLECRQVEGLIIEENSRGSVVVNWLEASLNGVSENGNLRIE
jgi:hypothetical protein